MTRNNNRISEKIVLVLGLVEEVFVKGILEGNLSAGLGKNSTYGKALFTVIPVEIYYRKIQV